MRLYHFTSQHHLLASPRRATEADGPQLWPEGPVPSDTQTELVRGYP